jgi:hypothetical protein
MKVIKMTVICVLIAFPVFAQAGNANVKWHDFNDYRDARPSNETKGSFHKRIASSYEKHFSKLAEQLPDGFTFNIEITELDLAGDRIGGMNEIRVIKDIYPPRIEFNYSVTKNNGQIISQADKVKLKDLGFMDRIKMGRDEAFYYEKRLVTDWFEKELLPSLSVN